MSSSGLVDQSRLNCYVGLICWNLLQLLTFGWMRMLVLLTIFKLFIFFHKILLYKILKLLLGTVWNSALIYLPIFLHIMASSTLKDFEYI
jgi:hypothetical protein